MSEELKTGQVGESAAATGAPANSTHSDQGATAQPPPATPAADAFESESGKAFDEASKEPQTAA